MCVAIACWCTSVGSPPAQSSHAPAANNSDSPGGGLASFFDAADNLVAAVPYGSPNDCTWNWTGWDFGSTPVKSIELRLNAGGAFQIMDDMEADIVGCGVNPGSAYCFGDGTGAACPCAGFGGTGEGCMNSTLQGATLRGVGFPTLSNDTFQLEVVGAPVGLVGIILKADNPLAVPIGDGILCLSGASKRSQVQVASSGVSTFSNFNGAPFGSVANLNAPTNFQYWYRDSSNTCSGVGFNFSNAWTVNYLP